MSFKRLFLPVFLLASLIAAAWVFRHPLFVFAFERAVFQATSEKVNYTTRTWSEGALCYTDLAIGETAKAASFTLKFQAGLFKPLQISLEADSLDITFYKKSSSSYPHFNWLAFITTSPFFKWHVNVTQGHLNLKQSSLPFSISSQQEGVKLNVDNTIFLDLFHTEEGFELKSQLSDVELSQFQNLFTLFQIPMELAGLVEGEAQARLSKQLELESFQADLNVLKGCFTLSQLKGTVVADSMKIGIYLHPTEPGSIALKSSFQDVSLYYQNSPLLEEAMGSLAFKKETGLVFQLNGFLGKKRVETLFQGEGGYRGAAEFWIQADLKSKEDSGELFLSFCQDIKQQGALQADFNQFDLLLAHEFLSFVPLDLDLEKMEVETGAIQGRIQATFQDRCIQGLYIENLLLENVGLRGEEKREFSCESLRVSAELEKTKKWDVHQLQTLGKKINFQMGKQRAEDLDFDLCIKGNHIERGVFQGSFQNFSGEVEVTGSIDTFHLKYHLLADVSLKEPLNLKGKGVRNGQGWVVEGSAYFSDELCLYGLSLDSSFYPQEGWAKIEHVTDKGVLPLLEAYGIDQHLSFSAGLDLSLEGEEIYGEFQLKQLSFETDKIDFQMPLLKENGQISYQLKNKKGRFSLPLEGAFFEHKEKGVKISSIGGDFQMTESEAIFKGMSGYLQETYFRGDIVVENLFSSERALHLETEEIQGRLEDFAPFVSQEALKQVKGELISRKGGLKLRLSLSQEGVPEIDWNIKGAVKEAFFPLLWKEAIATKVSGEFAYDSSAKIVALSGVRGDVVVENREIGSCSIHSFHYENRNGHTYHFKADLLEKGHPVLKLEGEGEAKDLLSCHLRGQYFNTQVAADLQLSSTLDLLKADATFEANSLQKEIDFLSKLGLLSLNPALVKKMEALEGSFKGRLGIDLRDQCLFEVKGESSGNLFELKGRKEKNEWIIDHFSADELEVKGRLSQKESQEGLPLWNAAFDMRWKEILCRGQLTYEKGRCFLKVGKISGLLPFEAPLHGEGLSEIVFEPSLELRQLVLTVQERGKIVIPRLKYDDHKWEVDKAKLTFFSPDLEEAVEALCTLRFSPAQTTIQASFSKGGVAVGQEICSFKSVQGIYKPDKLEVRGQVSYKQIPLQIQATFTSLKDLTGCLFVHDGVNVPGLQLSFLSGHVNELKGNLSGLEMNLKQKKPLHYQGSIQVVEGKQAAALLPPDLQFVKEISHLNLNGLWSITKGNYTFSGDLFGLDVELKGYLIDKMEAKVQISPDLVQVRECTITDRAGKIGIKQLQALKKGDWTCYVPLVRGQNIQPSLLRQKEKKGGEEKPFIIRNFSVTDLVFSLQDTNQIQGNIAFHFTNGIRKESSMLDIPLTLLKDLGLDFSLLSPTCGEVSGQLQRGRLLLKELKNSFSEGRRSEFYLAQDGSPSFIDLEGNLKINLHVKQDTLLKLAEPFILTIRGKIDHPLYAIQ